MEREREKGEREARHKERKKERRKKEIKEEKKYENKEEKIIKICVVTFMKISHFYYKLNTSVGSGPKRDM
jgi:hypothetical protein